MQLYRAQFFSMAYQLIRNLKGHPLASRMHGVVCTEQGQPYVWLPTTINTMRMIVHSKYFIGTSLHRVNQSSQAHRTMDFTVVLMYLGTRGSFLVSSCPRFKSFVKYARSYTHKHILMTDTGYRSPSITGRNRLPARPPCKQVG